MIQRLQQIKIKFGKIVLIRILVLLVGLLLMSVLGLFWLSSFSSVTIAVSGYLLGFLLRNKIADRAEHYGQIISTGLFIYGIILFLGDRFGIENYLKLAIITTVTVIIFNLQFWSLSDPTVINLENNSNKF